MTLNWANCAPKHSADAGIVTAEITDTISGVKRSRTGLDELMKLVRGGAINAALVYKLDRLGRSLPHLVQLSETVCDITFSTDGELNVGNLIVDSA